jgi:hypothetical protein
MKDAIGISERLHRAGADLVSLSEKIDTTSAAGLRTIGARLAAEGLLPRSGGRWHAKTIRDLLHCSSRMTRPALAPLVQRALAAIRRTLRRYPELRERTADYLAGNLPEGTTDNDEKEGRDKDTRR